MGLEYLPRDTASKRDIQGSHFPRKSLPKYMRVGNGVEETGRMGVEERMGWLGLEERRGLLGWKKTSDTQYCKDTGWPWFSLSAEVITSKKWKE